MVQRQPPVPPHIFKTDALLKHARPKLDSRFILDVNVIDGTMMAPSTAFTKIWRMRNNGTLVWPKGTQLVWIGGDKFSDSHSVDLEVCKLLMLQFNHFFSFISFSLGLFCLLWNL